MAAIDEVISYLESRNEFEACYYGGIPDNIMETLTSLNYAGVNFSGMKFPAGSVKEEYAVTIVYEERIPDGLILDVITGIKQLGWNFLSDQNVEPTYTRLPNSGLILEAATFYICKTKRWC